MTPPSNNELLAGKLELMTAERDKLLLELGDLRALRALPPSENTVLPCRNCAGFGWEPTVYSGRIPCSHCSTAPPVVNQPEAVVNEKSQQMAILQEKNKLFEGLSTGQVMQKAFAWCPTDHPHQWRMQWIADYFIANAPTLPQAERVLMTPEQISDTYKKATGQTLRPCDKHAVETLTREIEAHYEIGVKP